MEPSIKGFAMGPAIARLRDLRAEGRVSDLAWSRLEAEDVRLVEQGAALTIWYPVASQGRLLDALRTALGGTDAGLREFARETAREVLAAPALTVLLEGTSFLGVKLGPTLVRMARFGFSFGTWRFEGEDLTAFRVVADGMEPMPEGVCLNIQGFIEHLAGHVTGEDVRCTWTRPSASRLIFDGQQRVTPG